MFKLTRGTCNACKIRFITMILLSIVRFITMILLSIDIYMPNIIGELGNCMLLGIHNADKKSYYLVCLKKKILPRILHIKKSGRIYFGRPWKSDIVIINVHDP
jgi:hypothetical protein